MTDLNVVLDPDAPDSLQLQLRHFPAGVSRCVRNRWRPNRLSPKPGSSRLRARSSAGRAIDELPLRYALSNVLEDRGEYQKSFIRPKRGAGRRRASMSYRVESDEQAMQGIERVFDATLLSRALGKPQPLPGERSPLFVMGVPRSGTTVCRRADVG